MDVVEALRAGHDVQQAFFELSDPRLRVQDPLLQELSATAAPLGLGDLGLVGLVGEGVAIDIHCFSPVYCQDKLRRV